MERPAFTQNRGASLLYCTVVYLIAVPAAWYTFSASGLSPLWAMTAGLYVASIITFLAMLPVNNGSVFDAYWSILPPAAAGYFATLAAVPDWSMRQIAVMTVVWFWAIRLTLNWVRSFPGLHHEDFRYIDLYEKTPTPRWFVQLALVDLFPTLQIVLGCLPLYPALAMGDLSFGWLDGLALGVGLAATLIELVADEQMRAFVRQRTPGAHMESGLWRYSRHPNYFGEMLFWLSLWLFALAAAPAYWWTGIGVLAMFLMFVFASIPMMDTRSRERRPGFADYEARTSSLMLWPPKGN
ncbi:MAG TPA: hypothetical protein DCG06_14795 [Deltaproteobacteria bacterium]|nr:hypothetical protein [Deltaproteobacteria bacterium]